MGIQIGPWDPLKLTLNTLNQLLKHNILSYDDAHEIIINSLGDNMSQADKEEFVRKILIRNQPVHPNESA